MLELPIPSSNSYMKNMKKNNGQYRENLNKRMRVSSSNKSVASNGSNKSINKYGEQMQYLMQETDNSME